MGLPRLPAVRNPFFEQNSSREVVTDSSRPHHMVQSSGLFVCGHDIVSHLVGITFHLVDPYRVNNIRGRYS
jgi:hypothetical protein